MQWIGWYSAMVLNRLKGRCGHFWEARYFSTPIDPCDKRYGHECRRYRRRSKPARKPGWGSRLMQLDGGSGSNGAGRKWVDSCQQVLPWGGRPK
jgi:hypothetical protein